MKKKNEHNFILALIKEIDDYQIHYRSHLQSDYEDCDFADVMVKKINKIKDLSARFELLEYFNKVIGRWNIPQDIFLKIGQYKMALKSAMGERPKENPSLQIKGKQPATKPVHKIKWHGTDKELTEVFNVLMESKIIAGKDSLNIFATLRDHFERPDGSSFDNTSLQKTERQSRKPNGKAGIALKELTDKVRGKLSK